MSELKPCPFCGSEAEVFKDVSFKAETGEKIGEIQFFVWCTKCTALVSGNTEEGTIEAWNRRAKDDEALPSAQSESLSDAYMKAVWTWLLNYQIKAAELKGRYTPYEVLSWVANDWRKEHE